MICSLDFVGGKPGKRLKNKNLSLKTTFNKASKKLLDIEFEEGDKGTYIAVGPNSDNFNSLVGTIISKIPYHYHTWKEVEPEHTCTIYDELQVKCFQFNVVFVEIYNSL